MARKKFYTAAEVRAAVWESSDEEDLNQNTYDSDGIESESDNSSDNSPNNVDSESDQDEIIQARAPMGRGRIRGRARTRDHGLGCRTGRARVRATAHSRPRNNVVLDEFQWNNDTSGIDVGPFTEHIGPKQLPNNLGVNSDTLSFFQLYWGEDVWQNMVDCTNKQAEYIKATKPNRYYGKMWKSVTVKEMKAFWGLRIIMETLVVKNRYEQYWYQKPETWLLHTPSFAEVMARDRFLSIWSFLHIVDEQDPQLDKTDKIYKVRPLFNHLRMKFKKYYVPDKQLSLDEGMIPTKNKLSIRQYIKDKPIKWGIKTFLLCESKTGYICDAEIYTGKCDNPTNIEVLGATGNVVRRLLQDYQNKNYTVYTDRFYTSPRLYKYLATIGIHACGTVMTNRTGFPKDLIKRPRDIHRGDSEYHCSNKLAAVVWCDKKPIYFLSTAHDPSVIGSVNRYDSVEKKRIPIRCPTLVKEYNEYMGGTDKNDQITKLNKSRRHYKWPRRLKVKFFMWAAFCAYIIQGSFRPHYEPGHRPRTFYTFLADLVRELIGDYHAPKRRSLSRELRPTRLDETAHFPERPQHASTNHRCAVCKEKHNKYQKDNPNTSYKKNPFKMKKTVYCCMKCGEYLCIGSGKENCFQIYHTKVEYWS